MQKKKNNGDKILHRKIQIELQKSRMFKDGTIKKV